MKLLSYLALAGSIFAISSCSSPKKVITVPVASTQPIAATPIAATPTASTIPTEREGMVLKATAFRMSGDYTDNVAVTLDDAGNLAYFPAPSDVTSYSAPVLIGDGWWLNRQGLGANSVFTDYTFAQYAALQSVPTPEEIKAHIIPGARVTEMMRLPIAASEAMNMPAADLMKYIK